MRELERKTLSPSRGEIDLEQALRLLWRRRWLVLATTSLGIALGLVASVSQTATYTASTSIMAVETNAPPGLPSLGGLAGLLSPVSREASVTDKLVALLRSRTIVSGAIEHNRLLPALYPVLPNGWTEEQALNAAQQRVMGATRIETDPKAGAILIKVTYPEPRTAAGLANGYVSELASFLKGNSMSSAQSKRTFLEEKVAAMAQDVRSLEQQLISFQETNNLIAMDMQTQALVQSYSGLKTQLMAKQAELTLQQHSLSRNDIQLIGLRQEISQIKDSIKKIEQTGDGGFVPLKNLPKLEARNAQLQRDLASKRKLYDTLSEQLELTKVQEAYEALSFQVVDPAVAPMEANRSNRLVALLVGSFFGLVLGMLVAFNTGKLVKGRLSFEGASG